MRQRWRCGATRRRIPGDLDAGGCTKATEHDVGTKRIAVAGDPEAFYGLGDPSIVYPSGAAAGFMSYSAVLAANAPAITVHTRLATSTDHGATWS